MDPCDRLTDTLLDSAWATQAVELFADELRDLEQLEEAESELFQAELRRLREALPEASAVRPPSLDVGVRSPEKRGAVKARKGGAVGKRGLAENPPAHGSLNGSSKAAFAAAARKASRVVKEKEAALLRARGEEHWWRAVQGYKQQMQQAREEAEVQRTTARRQQRFFCSRGIDEYMMDDILHGAPGKSPKRKAGVTDAVGDEAWGKDASLDDGQFAVDASVTFASVSSASSPLRLAASGSGNTSSNNNSATCEFVLDAVAFATELNAVLQKEYGFRPILTRAGRVADSTVASSADLRAKLLTHAPGDWMGVGELWSSTLPPVVHAADDETTQRRQEQQQQQQQKQRLAVKGRDDESTVVSLPPVRRLSKGEVSGAAAAATVAGSSTSHTTSSRAAGGSSIAKIECSAANNCVRLRTTSGMEVSTTVRLTSRDPRRLRFRVRPSSHTWITYSIVNSSLGAPELPSSMPYTALKEPLACGGFIDVRVTFEPQSASEPSIREVLQIGHCREVNSCRGEGAKWHFFDVTVLCETALPQFRLIPALEDEEEEAEEEEDATAAVVSSAAVFAPSLAATKTTTTVTIAVPRKTRSRRRHKEPDQAVTICEFPYTFVMDSCTKYFYLENTGSDAVIKLSSSSPYFKIEPPPETSILLPGGDRMDVAVCFAPMKEARYDTEEFCVLVQESEEGPVVAEHRFGLRAEGVLPHVELVRIGPLELSKQQKDDSDDVPQYLVPGTAPGVETEVQVVVRNSCPIPVPYYWRTDSVGGGGRSCVQLRVVPASGTFPPRKNTSFRVSMRPTAAQPIAAVLDLFLDGLPTPPVDGAEVLTASSSLITAAAVAQYTRTKAIPAVPDHNVVDQMSDPYSVFHHCTRPQSSGCCGVFAAGFYLFADPVIPSLVIIPDHLEEGVECLVHYDNVRRITLQNKSPRPLHFCFDPKADECAPEIQLSSARDREGVEVKFQPRTGCVPPHASVTVTFRFTLRAVGHHEVSIDCYIPELMELLSPNLAKPMTTTGAGAGAAAAAAALASPILTDLRCSHQLHLSVTGIGPSVRVSTDFLDFGLIELGGEMESSFTVTNDNPIPVVFDLQDPMMREPHRFVFLPPSFRLGAGESVEVTVYRQAVEIGDAQTFFELVVRGGGTLAIETRATIQAPLLLLEEAVVNFGVVPEGSWVEQSFVVSNTSSFDVPYAVEPAALPSCIEVCVPPPGVVRAGRHGIQIPVRCAFGLHHAGDGGYEALLCIRNTRTPQELFVELRCERVQQLAVALNLIPVPKAAEGANAMAYAPPLLPFGLPPPPTMKEADYIEALLWNLVEMKVLNGNASLGSNEILQNVDNGDNKNNSKSADLLPASSALVVAASAETAVGMSGGTEELPVVLRPYCPPVVIKVHLPDGEPVWSELLGLRVSNQTGCHSSYSVEALRYSLGGKKEDKDIDTERILERKAASITTGMNTRMQVQRSSYMNRKMKPQQQQQQLIPHPTMAPSSSSETGGTAVTSVATTLNVNQHAFWCKGIDGTEQRERERRAALVSAQKVLLDGRGCATIFGGSSAGPLNPHDAPEVPVSIFANLPGRYEETLRVRCGDLPPTHIPLTLELSGKPVLLDATTGGFTVQDGKEVLLMPAVIAGVGRSRRTMFLISRVPRDLNVSVKIFLTTATFSVVAVDDDVAAGAVTLRLEPVSEEEQQRESAGKGRVAAAPETFFLPTMASKEVTIEYAPDATFVKAADKEREWRGGVIITAEVAETAFNDGFLIDEFYRINATRYPAERFFKTKRLREPEPAWMKSIVRPIAMLKVQPSFISVPGVVKNNVIISPKPGEITAIKKKISMRRAQASDSPLGNGHHGRNVAGNARNNNSITGGGAGGKNNNNDGNSSRSSSDDENEEEDDGLQDDISDAESSLQVYASSEKNAHDSLEMILAKEGERDALRAFIAQRRQEVAAHCRRYFIPIELEVRARCGVAKLTVEPSGDVVRFPPYVEGTWCGQSLRLSNMSCAAMEFILDVPSPSFQIVSTRFISTSSEDTALEADDEEKALTRRMMESLKWSSRAEQKKARMVVASSKRRCTADLASMEVTVPRFAYPNESDSRDKVGGRSGAVGGGGGGAGSPHKDANLLRTTKHRLRPHDVLEVVVEYCRPSREEVDAMMRRCETVDGCLNILYIPDDAMLAGQPTQQQPPSPLRSQRQQQTQQQPKQQQQTGDTAPAVCSPPVLELLQVVPLAVIFSSPSVSCSPSQLWFRPGQLLHDGRPQPSYTQKMKLLSSYPSEVSFVIIPSHLSSTPVTTAAPLASNIATTKMFHKKQISSDETSTTQKPSLVLTRERQLKEVTHYWDEAGDGEETAAEARTADVHVMGEVKHLPQEEPRTHSPSLLLQKQQHQQQQLIVLEDATRFTIVPTQGVIPAATRGGQPGVFEVDVRFTEHVNVRFEAAYDVMINDRLVDTCRFTLRGDSRETEI